MNNVLDPADQGIFLTEQAINAAAIVQCVWAYNRAIDVDRLRQFHRHLQRGRLCRAIECSPLPFGRHRWVSPERSSDLEIVAAARPRDEFDAWLVEQAATPLDAEHGPGWHLAMLRFTDGGAGVSLVISHSLADGIGLCEALVDAARGHDNPFDWLAPGTRSRWRALREDARQAFRDIPAIGRAVVAGARLARATGGAARSARPLGKQPADPGAPRAGADERIIPPTATFFVDLDEWNARAKSLGGTSNALLVGLAVRMAQRVGRTAPDGSVVVAMPVNERTPGDTRANAVSNVDIAVPAAIATTDLRGIRAAIKQALIRHRNEPDEQWAMLPLIPLVPKWLAKRTASVAAGPANCVVATYLGAIDPAATRPDGTVADHFAMQSLFPGVSTAMAHRAGGRLALGAGIARGRVFVSAMAYQPNRPNSNDKLRQDLSQALRDFSLTATAGWGGAGHVHAVA